VSIYNNSLNSISASTALSIADGQTSGILTLGTNTSRTGAISIGGNNCTINLGGYLTPLYSATSTLPTTAIGYIVPTQSYSINPTGNFTSNIEKTLSAASNISTPGVYCITARTRFTATTGGGLTFAIFTIKNTANSDLLSTQINNITTVTSQSYPLSMCGIVHFTATDTIRPYLSIAFPTGPVYTSANTNFTCTATRIA
jgi:hypothetical protein